MIATVLLIVFMAVMIGVGIYGMRRSRSADGFFLGDRDIGMWISAFAYGTSYFSAVIFIGFAGSLGWAMGLDAVWIGVGNAIFGGYLAWRVLGARTRRMSQNLGAMTMPEFLEARYGSPFMKVFAALVIFIFLLPYSASVYKGLGYLFEANFGISFQTALLVMTAITGVYLVLGGYFAVAVTDFIQGLIMLVGSAAMVALLVGKGGGLAAVWEKIPELHLQHVPTAPQRPWYALASLVFMTSFGVWGLPQMVQKFYAIRSEKMIPVGAVVTTVFATVIGISAYFTGAMSHLFYDALPVNAAGQADLDRLIPDMLQANLPEFLMAVILLLVLSASMSTLSSLVLVSSSAIAIDLCRGRLTPNISQAGTVRLLRALSLVFVAVSCLLALYPIGFILTLMSLSWGAVAGSFLAAYLYGLYWRRTTAAGAWGGMLCGLGLSVGLFFYWDQSRVMGPVAASIGMIVPLFVVPMVSVLTTAPEASLLAKAFDGIGGTPKPAKTASSLGDAEPA